MSRMDPVENDELSFDFSDIPDPLEAGAAPSGPERDLVAKITIFRPLRRDSESSRWISALGLFLFGAVLAFAAFFGLRRDWASTGAMATMIAPLLLAAPALWLARSPGSFGLGPSVRQAKVVFALFGAMGAAMIVARPASQSWPERAHSIAACCGLGVGVGLSLGALVALAARRRLVGSALLRSSLLGLGVGAIALSALGTHCRVADWAHVGIGHIAPVTLLVGLGALLSRTLRA